MMGRLLVVAGIIAMLGSCFGLTSAIVQPVGEIVSSVSPDALEQQATELCGEGESIEIEQGAETYSPSSGWGRPTYFYCVDGQGNRREVTDEFGSDLLDATTSTVFSAISGAMTWVGVSMLGFFALLIGIIMIVRKPKKNKQTMQYASSSPSPISGDPGFEWTVRPSSTQSTSSEPSDLSDRLQKLEEARSANLISQEEYDRMRQNILNKF